MTTELQILKELELGQDVAENEPRLDEYFLETESFNRIVAGEVDLIRGLKGTGKSAIYRILTTDGYDIPRLNNVQIVPATNPTGSVIFSQMLGKGIPEPEFRLLWTAYFATLVGNHACDTFGHLDSDKINDVKEFLTATGLRTSKVQQKSLLSKLRDLKRLRLQIGTSLDGMPSVGFEVELEGQNKTKMEIPESGFLDLIEILISIFEDLGIKCWVAIDRLDEAFSKNSDEELLALRGLLRAHMQICALGGGQDTLRPKIFIRSDIFDRITRIDGFANATHFRTENMVWNAKGVAALVWKRVTSKATVCQLLKQKGLDINDPVAIWYCLMPDKIVSGGQKGKSLKWILSSTCDGTGAFNPRNVLTFLSLAQTRSLDVIRMNPQSLRAGEVISSSAIQSAFGELSRVRLEDTILAEFPEARPFVDKMRGGVATFDSKEELCNTILGTESSKQSCDEIIDRLIYIGLIKRISHQRHAVAFLYRPALKAGNRQRALK